ncbi:hypothetical protein FNU79_16170 [Deinococcus detaillensis]|uniref:Lipoprotein n=1 Tax=Deinococcus detaillensis TaxID=2592048 RepID=A0A553UKP9_9DEIO|nr:hypothetical protein [Deinococcus detaillensis]TSA80778.1 hypothetical protein FNU79_16170 [Deinococcus detaillensis]
MKKRFGLLALTGLIALSSCAPALQAAQQESASLKIDGASVIFVNPGPDTATAPALLLSGDFVTTDQNCKRRASGYTGCTLPDTPAKNLYRVAIAQGKVTAGSITFYKASSGVRPIYLRLP